MANYLVTDTQLTSVANAIRTKTGGSSGLSFPDGFVSGIGGITVGSPDVWDGFGKNPTLIYTYDQSLKLSDTSYDSSNLSTTSTKILDANDLTSVTYDESNYSYIIFLFGNIQFQYNTDNLPSSLICTKQVYINAMTKLPQGDLQFADTSMSSWTTRANTTSGEYIALYRNSNNKVSITGTTTNGGFSSGVFLAFPNISFSQSLIILKTPAINASLANSYFNQTAADAIDINNTIINYTFKIYQYDKKSLYTDKLSYYLINYSGIT